MALSSRWRARWISLAVIALLVALGLRSLLAIELTTDITRFLPESEDRELARIAKQMSGSDLNRSVTLLVSSSDAEDAAAAAGELAERLARAEEVEWVRSGPDEGLEEAFYALYFDRRLGFADVDTSEEGLRERARDLKRRLMSPTGTFIRQVAPADPLLTFPRLLERMRAAQQGSLEVVDGRLVTEDGRGVVFLATRSSPFDSEASRRLAARIDGAFAEVQRAHPDAELAQSGVHRLAIASEDAIRSDVTRISVVSSIGVVLLFLLLFRSVRHLLLAVIPLLAGFAAALTVTQLAFGSLHGLSMAFGATLIGVAIDYVAHALNHHTLAPSPEGPTGSLRRIWPGLALGAGTTIAGLAGLAWTSFPGIRELAVFTSVGVFAALLATRWLLPPWLPLDPAPTRLHRRLADGLGRWMLRLRGSTRALVAIPIVALVICAAGLSQLVWVDDVRSLNTMDAELLAEDERVRAAVSRMDGGRFVIAWGADEQQALERNDRVYERLTEAMAAGELERFRSVRSLLPSAAAQRASFEALTNDEGLYDRVTEALVAEGFVPDGFAPFREALEGAPPPPLTWGELAASPIGDLVRPFRVDTDETVAFISLTRGADVDALERRFEGVEGVRVFDQGRFMQSAYGRFRRRTLELVGLGLLGVFLMVFVRYRRLSLSLAAFAPAVLAAATALASIVLLGFDAGLMHLVALLLVLSMGVDYGVFMVESRAHEEGPAPTVVSLLVACISTVLSFGLLAMSVNPALRALGLVTSIGVGLSLLLAPLAWLLLPQRAEPKAEEAQA